MPQRDRSVWWHMVLVVIAAAVAGAAVPSSTMEALHDLWVQTDGPNWRGLCWVGSTWSDIDPCDRQSMWNITGNVVCDAAGNAVTQLLLYSCNLNGTIPDSVGNLVSLTVLELNSNNLSGRIPDSIGNLVNLTVLDLDTNNLSGSIPDSIGNMTNLTYINFNSNRLSGTIPDWIGNFIGITWLNLDANNLHGTIPNSICNLVNLMGLYLSSNDLGGTIPESIGNLVNLRYLTLNSNSLSGTIPESIGNLINLKVLALFSNNLIGLIPDSIGNLVNLEQLQLNSNRFTGDFPFSISNLRNLEQLNLESNHFVGSIPRWIANLSQLQLLQLGSNQFSGPIPSSIQYLQQLYNFSVGSNPALTGDVPAWVCNMPNLTFLRLEFTQLGGSIPRCMSNLTYLQYVDLRGLPLTGELPPELFEIPSLTYLLLSGARFSGGIPAVLATPGAVHDDLTTSTTTTTTTNTVFASPTLQLRLLTLTACGLSGEIPQWLVELPYLTTVELSGNNFNGPIPFFPPNTTIEQFSAANNRFTGSLESLRHARSLTRLDVDSNMIGGTLTQWLADQSPKMTLLSATNNLLSCALPESTAISVDKISGDTKLSVLVGNLFGCPVPEGVERSDENADSYSCGSEEFRFAAIFFGTSVAVVGVTCCILFASGSRFQQLHPITHVRDMKNPTANVHHVDHDTNNDVSALSFGSLTLERFITWLLILATVVLVVILLPTYAYSPAIIECRFGWSTTAAFLAPTSVVTHAAWGYTVAAFGGICLGGVIVNALVVVGGSYGYVASGSSLAVGFFHFWRAMAVCALGAAVFAILVGINAGFVLLEESSHTSGVVKDVVVVIFALLHEALDHIATPLIVSVLVFVATPRGTTGALVRPSVVFAASVAVEIANSVIAPMIALLGVSDGCFRDVIFSRPEPVDTFVNIPYCTGTGYANESSCISEGFQWKHYPAGVSYTPPFRFEGQRCISSIITLYTPEYLIIFAIRVLLHPVGWWLGRRGTPWMVAGIQPPVMLRVGFVRARRRLVKILACGCFDQNARESDDDDDDRDDEHAFGDGDDSEGTLIASHDQSTPRAPMTSLLRARADATVETLHAIEPAGHRFNLLVIAIGPGMFSPVVSLAALTSLTCLNVWEWILERRFGHASGTHNSKPHACHGTGQNNTASAPHAHAVHPLPLVAVPMLLFVNTLYLVVLLSTSGFVWQACTVSVISWVALGVSCWWKWVSLSGESDHHPSTSMSRGHVQAPIELTEMLLAPVDHDYVYDGTE